MNRDQSPNRQSERHVPLAHSVSGERLRRYVLPSLVAAGSLGLLEIARSRYQASQVFEPTRYPLGQWDPAKEGLRYEDVEFLSEDGTKLHGWWFGHDGADMTLVYCHGNRGSIAERVEVFASLLRLKVNVFAFDYRGYGKSEGSPSEQGVFADARAAVDYAAARRDSGLRSVLLFGHSLGGAIAIDAALHRPVGGLVVQSSFTQLADMARHRHPDLPMHWICRNEFRSIEKVPRLQMPKLFIHGGSDRTVPHEHGRALFEAAAKPKDFLSIAKADHNDVHLWGSLRYFSRLIRFRRRCSHGE
ncbi:MAG: alpha/beta hydrolase [Thermoanaerobaculia bacterium]|nr:alpha/beta hydrolase [Thermoanaerobaculia bacterium]